MDYMQSCSQTHLLCKVEMEGGHTHTHTHTDDTNITQVIKYTWPPLQF